MSVFIQVLILTGIITGSVLIVFIAIGILFRKVPLMHEYHITQCTEHDQHEELPHLPVPEAIFFDEKDISAMEAHEEYPDYHGTVVELNGIKTDHLGMIPEEPRKSWWRR